MRINWYDANTDELVCTSKGFTVPRKIAVTHGGKFHYYSKRCSKCREIKWTPRYVSIKDVPTRVLDWIKSLSKGGRK